jgi:hypothetical protein
MLLNTILAHSIPLGHAYEHCTQCRLLCAGAMRNRALKNLDSASSSVLGYWQQGCFIENMRILIVHDQLQWQS